MQILDREGSISSSPASEATVADEAPEVLRPRHAGILLHPTSLPGRFGIGDLGPDAYRFVDLLKTAGQTIWQLLPLGPAGDGNSPYSARSAFAGNPLLISLTSLVDEGLIDAHELELDAIPDFPAERVDYEAVIAWKESLLRRAYRRFTNQGRQPELDPFIEANKTWLPDYCLYMALREEQARPWHDWPAPLATRDAGALADARGRLEEAIAYNVFLQSRFSDQWGKLRDHANRSGVQIFGDLPIFLADDSADVWANQRIFHLDAEGRPLVLAGVPPDYFSETGQLWGNPVYRWDVLRADGYSWWVERFRRVFELVDLVRIDHFRGFQASWHVPAGETTAKNGDWVPGPGIELFERVEEVLGRLPIVAEDLGIIDAKVRRLLKAAGYPGMKVLQFAFTNDASNPYLPHHHIMNCVVYTGTHDNDTTGGWYAGLTEEERERVWRYLGRNGSAAGADITSELIRVAYQSVAEIAMVPMQDLLRLGSEARMNTPAEARGNWAWRFRWEQIEDSRTRWLGDLAETYGRVPAPESPGTE
jgi:4-alpha-glucanotransferase